MGLRPLGMTPYHIQPHPYNCNCNCPECIGPGKEVIRYTISWRELDNIAGDQGLLPILTKAGMPLILTSKGIKAAHGELKSTDSGSYREFVWIGDKKPNQTDVEIQKLLDPNNPLPEDLAEAYQQGLVSLNQQRLINEAKTTIAEAHKALQKLKGKKANAKSYLEDNEPQRSIDLTHED